VPLPEISSLSERLAAGDRLALARAITLVENNLPGSYELLEGLHKTQPPGLVGITGPPGAGKSTLVNALLELWTRQGLKIAVIAVDPSSPFHYGALLGDRIRMSRFYNEPLVFIRSLASRGSLGGLHPRIYEICDLVREAGFDRIILETVGVGQSEVEVAGIADCTVVTLVPEAGDMIQTLKAGLLEIADIFVVNKSDRAEAELMYQNLRSMVHERNSGSIEIPVLKTISHTGEGVEGLSKAIEAILEHPVSNAARKEFLQLQKLYHLIREIRMNDISKEDLSRIYRLETRNTSFNIYKLAERLAMSKMPSKAE